MTAKEYIYQMIDTYPIPNHSLRMVHAGEKAVETAMVAFAQEKVKEALEAACRADEYYIKESYPLENVK